MTGHAKSEHWLAHFLSVCTHHLPAALMVAAIVGICHHRFHLLDAVDGYAFLGIGNLTAHDVSQDLGDRPTVAVVLIDQQSHEDYYRERNPLDRCELKKDLEAIYDLPKPPKLLVIDLDLSPSMPVAGPENDAAEYCNALLRTLLGQLRPTQTVLMAPFEMLDAKAQANIEQWREDLEGYVSFADPIIRIRYGLVNAIDCSADSLAAVAFDNYPNKPVRLKNCLSNQHKEQVPPLVISPGQYFSGLRAVALSELPSRKPQCDPCVPTNADLNLPVVFLGSGYGDSDTYLTPVGTMYGVEVHAAAFMSLLQPTKGNDALAFVLDVGLGLLMGSLIDLSWRRYFSLRFSSSAFDRQRAPWRILLLGAGLSIVVLMLTFVSFWLLRHCSLWLSPIPIALGMLIESFFSSAVRAAVEEGYEQRQALINRLEKAQGVGPDSFAQKVAEEREQRPHHAHGLQERATRFFYLDFARLLRSGQYWALALLILRRLAFFLLLLFALFIH
ncbi:CHASE2 domain-containing protein [Pseudomonas sp. SDO55104_S430]